MIIVQLSGGLGNQMFQYSLYQRLKIDGKEVKIDDRTCYAQKGCRNKQLEAFLLEYEAATQKEIMTMTDASRNPLLRLRRKLFGRKDLSYREAQFNFDKTVLAKENTYLEGCFQTEKYFAPIKEKLKQDFIFKHSLITRECKEYLEQIEKTESISVHIRRGDYLSDIHAPLYGNICTKEYYQIAIKYLKQKYSNAVFYVFANDIAWAEENMKGEEFVIVNCSNEETGYLDMFLMSHCKHNIIANSSFSWWAAWLNENKDKTVIAPKKWLNGRECGDIYTDGMLVF